MTKYHNNDDDMLELRLFNTKNQINNTVLKIEEQSFNIEFAPFEIKTFVLANNQMRERN